MCGVRHRRYVDPLEEFQEEVQSYNGYELRGSSRHKGAVAVVLVGGTT